MAGIARRVTQLKRFSHQVFDSRTVHAACERVNHRWRERLLDPVTTLRLAWMLAGAAREAGEAFGRWHGHRVLLIDGSGLSMPDTPALQQRFGQPGRLTRYRVKRLESLGHQLTLAPVDRAA